MDSIDLFFVYFSKSTAITIFVLGWLSFYFVLSFTILFSRVIGLNSWKRKESSSLHSLLFGASIETTDSVLRKQVDGNATKEKLSICYSLAENKATSGLTILAIIASTSPFIGLFGTVVSILQTFSNLGTGGSGLNVIAPAISEALVATGCGIFVAIPAYSFNLIIKRKAYEVLSIIDREINYILSSK